jgi:hypothetical protein
MTTGFLNGSRKQFCERPRNHKIGATQANKVAQTTSAQFVEKIRANKPQLPPRFRRESAQNCTSTTTRIYFLTTYRSHAIRFPSSLVRGVSGDDPEGGAGSGVLRRRLVTVRPGRPGTPPSRHYDLGARSSLHGSGRQLPAVVGRRAPKETEARPREPKTATVERREASVPRHGTQGASLGAWRIAS